MLSKKFLTLFTLFLLLAGFTAGAAQPARASDNAVRFVPMNVSDLAEQAKHGVVNIQVTKRVHGTGFHGRNPFEGSPFEDFFKQFRGGMPERDFRRQGVGSGFIIDKEGFIITNNHVVSGADELKVRLADKREFDAEVIGTDPQTDLALIRIKDAENLQPLTLGDSDNLKTGDWVVAIGSPFGLEQTVTTGIVSAKGRVIGAGPYDDFIQTDASINPGNSGGPLLSLEGKVIGINTAIIASGQGIGFAIPVNLAKHIVDQLRESGHVTRGWLGVGIQDLNADLKKYYDVEKDEGVLVSQVFEGEPAEEAGIKEGDVIISVNGEPVKTTRELSTRIANMAVGERARITVLREGDEKTVTVKLGERRDDESISSAPSSDQRLGLGLAPLDDETRKYFGYDADQEGVLVTEVTPDSPADEAGFQRGDLILEVNRKPVSSVPDVKGALRSEDDAANQFLVKRGRGGLWVATIKPSGN